MTSIEPVSNGEPSWLPDPHLLRVKAAKMTEYLLKVDHPIGAAKAKFFRGVGFSEEDLELFAASPRQQATQNKIADVVPHQYGVKTVVDCFMSTPCGRDYCIRTVWNDHEDGAPPKRITAYPL